MALGSDIRPEAGEAEFWIGDTATPVPLRYCVPLQTLHGIVADFLQTGEPSARVTWEEV
jgi:hypothetical protein